MKGAEWTEYDTNVVARVFSWALANGYTKAKPAPVGRKRVVEVLGKLGVSNPDAYWPQPTKETP